MKVVFAVPTYDGMLEAKCVISLFSSFHLLNQRQIQYDLIILSNCSVLPMARNILVSMFMDTDATDLFFIDSDIGFDPMGVINLLERQEYIVAGLYPLKKDDIAFPVKVKMIDGVPIGRDGLVEAERVPGGFMRIKRYVIEEMQRSYPELKYEGSVIEVSDTTRRDGYDLFNMGRCEGGQWTTEDYAFCDRWTKIGGQLWVYPDITFEHIGKKCFKANYHESLFPGSKLNA